MEAKQSIGFTLRIKESVRILKIIVQGTRWISLLVLSCLLLGLVVPAGLARAMDLQMNHVPSAAYKQQDYTIDAVITNNGQSVTGAVYYEVDAQPQAPISLDWIADSTYRTVIPADRLNGQQLDYYIEVTEQGGLSIRSTGYHVELQDVSGMPGGTNGSPDLLITELVPDTENVSGSDAYEYVEVYNNTDKTIQFGQNYYFYYNNKDKWTPDSSISIPAHSPIVFWVMNGVNETIGEQDFIRNFSAAADLVEGVNLFRINGNGGMANTASRNIQIRSAVDNSVIVSATYDKEHVSLNKGIVYQLPDTNSVDMVLLPTAGKTLATPGIVQDEQLIQRAEGTQPIIVHTPAETVNVQDLEIVATVKNLSDGVNPIPEVQLLYKTPSQVRFTAAAMSNSGGEQYRATIPAAALVESRLDYKIRVRSTVESYSVNVNIPQFNADHVPQLLVTELVPNSTNVTGTSSDAYEFIEIYNNTDQSVNFNNYKIYYRYPDKGVGSDVKWASTKTDLVIPAQKSVVFWIINSMNSGYSVDDFNNFYHTNLVMNDNLFQIQSDGMANSGSRGVVIKTNTEREISAAYYNSAIFYDGGTAGDETREDNAIEFKYPVDGSTTMIKISSGIGAPTPGTVNSAQVPAVPVHVVPDMIEPEIEDMTGVTVVDQAEALHLQAFAKDDRQVASVQVFIRSDKQPQYVQHNLIEDYNDKLYHYKLTSADLIGRSYIEYYFVVSDGTNEIKSNTVRVNVVGGPDHSPLRLNVKDGDVVHGEMTLKGTAEQAGPDELQLRVDGKVLNEQDTFPTLEQDAYFVFEANSVDYYFKNAITMGDPSLKDKTILYTFMDPITSYTTLSFPIEASRLQLGEENTIYIRAGSKSSPFDDRVEENKDDFEIKNVRLLLADGTEIWDPSYAVRDKEIKMGDSSGKQEWIGFHFHLTPELLKSKAYSWDTRNVADGEHTVELLRGTDKLKSTVIVDNTAPSIQATIEDGKEYRGQFTIDASAEDHGAGIDRLDAKLDDQSVVLPYVTSSGKLKGGAHVLVLEAADKVGNKSQQTIRFSVPNENPNQPELVSPRQGQEKVSLRPDLTVKVTDPTEDPMDVFFYRGFKYDGNRAEGFTGYKNASDTEPPKMMVPQGEQALTAQEYEDIRAVDGNYLVNDAVDQFPYQRYEIALDSSIKPSDQVNIVWNGHSLEGRKVSLYAWSEPAQRWEQLVYKIAGTEDFELSATVLAGDYMLHQAKANTIQIMIQDEIAAASKSGPVSDDPYDFSFLWMSDTQYYSQDYPYIYQKNVEWIADNKDRIKLKYVIHTGDIVDKEYQEYQWLEADKDMKVLENANIPYGVLAGNHDVGHQQNDYTNYWKYFGEDRFKNMPTFAGSYDNNRGHYDLVSAGGNDFIIVYMGWGLGDKEIEWMNQVVAKYPERKAILALHEYLLVSNNRAPIADQIFEKVIKPNKNVIAALSGHYHDAQLKIDELDDDGDGISDRKVYQMLADYQGAEEGGLGYIRLMQFDMKNNKLHMKTYSPYLDDYNYYDPQVYPGKDEFSLDLDLQPKTKRVATDYIGVKVYTDQLIGQKTQVESGANATAGWSGLASDRYYQWYVRANDEFSGSATSDIWGFYTGSATEPGRPDPNPEPKPDPTPDPGTTAPGAGGHSGTTPNPGASSQLKDGVIVAEAGEDGSYSVSKPILEQAIQAAKGTILIQLQDAGEAAKLDLDAAVLGQLQERKLTIRVDAGSIALTIPATSLTSDATEADKVILYIETISNPSLRTDLQTVLNRNADYRSTDLVYTLRMVAVKAGQEVGIDRLAGPVKVERKVAPGQLNWDYAGIYRIAGDQAAYLGGAFNKGSLEFTTDQLSSFAVLEYHKAFADVTGTWAQDYIQKLTAKHVINGVDSQHFQPNQEMSRADFVTLLVRASGLPAAEGASPFNDVASNTYYGGYVTVAAELGLIQGSGGAFRPQAEITREEAAVVIDRWMSYLHKTSAGTVDTVFTDRAEISAWAKEAVNRLQAQNVINGKGNQRFDPQGELTRAEVAKMIYVVMNR